MASSILCDLTSTSSHALSPLISPGWASYWALEHIRQASAPGPFCTCFVSLCRALFPTRSTAPKSSPASSVCSNGTLYWCVLETIPFKIPASPAHCLRVFKLCLTLCFYTEFTTIWPNVCVSSPVEHKLYEGRHFWLGHCCICSPWRRPNNTMQVLSYAYGLGVLLALQQILLKWEITHISLLIFFPPLSLSRKHCITTSAYPITALSYPIKMPWANMPFGTFFSPVT